MTRKNEKGQIALILVLAATVAGTLVISLADRSTRNLRTQSLDTERVKALKGAESGVEQALINEDSVDETVLDGNVKYEAEYLSETGDSLVSADLIAPGDAFDLLIDGSEASLNEIRVFFSSESSLAAIKITEYMESGGTYSIDSRAYDEHDSRRVGGSGYTANNFSDSANSGDYTINGVYFANRVSFTGVDSAVTKLYRITVLYEATKIGIRSIGGNLPAQQVVVSGTGTYAVSAGDSSVKKRLELTKDMSKVPVVFDNVLYSGSRL